MPILSVYEAWLRDRYWIESRADEIHKVRCADGVRIAVKRFHAQGTPRPTPVLCIPGLGADSHNFDAPEPNGLAPFLAAHGFEVFVVDLRGTGLSEVDPKSWSKITYDDFANKDVPAALRHVLDVTGADGVTAIGHSMGGMLIYSLLGTDPLARYIKGAITICSPLGFPQGWEVAPLFQPVWWLGEHIPGFHAGKVLRWLVPLAMRPRDVASRKFLVRANMDIEYARRLMHRAVQDIPRGVLLQFRDWVMHDAFRSLDGRVDYRARLVGVRTPTLVVAAPKDGLARPDAVRRALPLLANARLLYAATEAGFSADYGHIDVVFGVRAHSEVFPQLAAFLAEQDDVARPQEGAAAAHVH